MTIEGDVAQTLKAYGPLASLVGGRVAPVRETSTVAPPCVVYQRISTVFEQAMGDEVVADDVRLQLTAWSRDSDEEAGDIADAMVSGVLGMNPGTRSVKATVIDNEIADWEPTARMYRRIVDVVFVSTAAGG